MQWPKVEVKCSKSQTEYKFIGGGWLPSVMCLAMLGAIFVPYFIVLYRGNLNPLLPYVSQASGSPPQSGIFAIFIAFSSLLAFIGLNLMHMAVRMQKKRLEDKWDQRMVSLLNKISLIPGHFGILGMVIVAGYPMDFQRTTDHWLSMTIIPHLIGALSLFLGGLFYCILITYILALLHPEKRQLLGVRVFLIGLIASLSAIQGYTVRDAFVDEFTSEIVSASCLPEIPDYNLSYLVSATSEWLLLLAFVVFFLSLREEAREFCLTMTVTLKEEEVSKNSTVVKTEIKTTEKDENQNLGEEKVETEK